MRCRVPRSAVSSRDVHGRGGLRAISATGNIAWHRGVPVPLAIEAVKTTSASGTTASGGLRILGSQVVLPAHCRPHGVCPRRSTLLSASSGRRRPSDVCGRVSCRAAWEWPARRASPRAIPRRTFARGLIGRSSCVVYGWCGARVRLRNRIVTSVPSSQPRIAANSVSQTSGTVECANTQSTRTSRVFVVASATT
jgi:hypothetical protein